MGIYIKGMNMPEKDTMVAIIIRGDGKVQNYYDLTCKQIATAEEVKETEHGEKADEVSVETQ